MPGQLDKYLRPVEGEFTSSSLDILEEARQHEAYRDAIAGSPLPGFLIGLHESKSATVRGAAALMAAGLDYIQEKVN